MVLCECDPVKKLAPISCLCLELLAVKSPSNKVLRRAFSIVWNKPDPNLYCVDWINKDGSPQNLLEMN